MRQLLFSKGFFALLAGVLFLDMAADLAEQIHPQHLQWLNHFAIALDAIGFVLAIWMFIDLSRRRPTDGDHPRSR